MVSRTRCRTFALAVFALAPAVVASPATPTPAKLTKDQCIESNAKAQSLRRSGNFTDARERLKICVDSRCPRIVRDDCVARLDELERTQPSVVFDAKSPEGADLSAVDVQLDGRPWTNKLDGTALPVDSGEHTFTFVVPGQPAVTRQLVIREGEKGRREAVVIGTAKAVPSSPPTRAAAPAPSPADVTSPSNGRLVGLVLGGVGVAGIAVGSVFGLLTKGAVDRQNKDCPQAAPCLNQETALHDHNVAVRDGLISDIGFIAGGALLAGGAALFFLSGPRAPSQQTGGFVVVPSAERSGAGISMRALF